MASFFTPLQRLFNSYKRLVAVLLFLILLLILYKQHSSFQSKSPEIVISSKEKQIDKDIVVVDSQEKSKNNQYGYDEDDRDFHTENKLQYILSKFQSHIDNLDLQIVPENIIQEEKCPACYGNNLCSEIASGKIKVHVSKELTRDQRKGVYFGKWESKNEFIAVKTLGNTEEFQRFDRYICTTVMGTRDCYMKSAVINEKSPVVQEKSFQPINLLKTKQIVGSPEDQLAFASCAGSELISELSRAYDSNGDTKLTTTDIANFYFSSVVNPEPVLLQFIRTLKAPLPVPRYFGSCGRVIVVEAVGQTLDNFLNADWNFRVDLALQLLDMIDLFVNGDPDWGIMFADFHFDNFAVNEEGQLYVIDLEDIALLEKSNQMDATSEIPCNWECMKNFIIGVLDPEHSQHETFCTQVMDVGTQVMHFFACQLFSDRPKDKISYKDQGGKELTTGLLHDPPKQQAEDLYGYIDECIMETTAGGRLDAMESLKTLLETWAYGDDDGAGAINAGDNYQDGDGNADDNDDDDDNDDRDDNDNDHENM